MADAVSKTATKFPRSSEEVLAVIEDAERHRKFVWTPGRVLREAALWTRVEGFSYGERKAELKCLAGFLNNLAAQGIFQRRAEVQSIGYGDETGYDYVERER